MSPRVRRNEIFEKNRWRCRENTTPADAVVLEGRRRPRLLYGLPGSVMMRHSGTRQSRSRANHGKFARCDRVDWPAGSTRPNLAFSKVNSHGLTDSWVVSDPGGDPRLEQCGLG